MFLLPYIIMGLPIFVGKKLNTPDDFGTVKLSKPNVVIPQGKTIPVTFRVRAGPVSE